MKSWIDVSVLDYIEIIEVSSQDLTPTEMKIERLSIVTGVNYFEADADVMDLAFKQFKWIYTPPIVKANQSFAHLSFGNFVDLEFYCTQKTPIENIAQICSVITGQTVDQIEAESIAIHFSTLENYLKYRVKILETYKGLFEDDDPEPEDEINEDEPETKKPIASSNGWQHLIHGLAKGDVTKANAVTSLGHILVLNWLSIESQMKPNH